MTAKTIFLLATLILSSAWAAPASAQDDAPSPHLNLGEENLAVTPSIPTRLKSSTASSTSSTTQDGFNALEHWNRDEATTRQRADIFWNALQKKDDS